LGPGGVLGEPTRLGSTALAAVFIEDFDGDGLADLLGAAPDDATPLRLWLQRQDPRSREKNGMLPAETRFESPAIREAEPVRFPGRAAASIGVIEKASRRMVFYDVVSTPAPQTSPEAAPVREVRAEVAAFTGGASADRSVAMVDLDLDGLEDLLATDAASNTVVWHRQAPGAGLGRGEPFSALKKPKSVAAGQWDGQGPPEVFILSEEEKAVGVSAFDAAAGRLAFPTPLPVKTAGATPVAMDFVGVGAGGMLAVIVRDRRDHTLELHAPASGGVRGPEAITAVKLEGVSRPPQAMLAADADQDGATDLLLFTPNEPMVMVRGAAEGGAGGPPTQVLTDKTMPQFGLVQAAGPDNTALLDIDANGKPELLIADENFVRAARYSPETGWSVVEQITMPEPGTQFVGVAVLPGPEGEVIVASDKGHGRLVLIGRAGEGSPRAWTVTQQLRLKGFDLGPVFAGRFGGGQEPTVLAIGADGFALVRLDGAAARLEQFAAYRSESEDRNEHEMEPGDLNGDGFVDIAVLDSGDRMCQLLTFSAARKLHLATEFEVFQTKRFARGRGGDGEPRDAMVADLTGDGRHDLLITVHDRLNIYRQAVAPGPRAEVAR
ncbi:MAG TPA: VCBS repeat-containing protein, partial [Phycisphaerales bacterium]|nr:VCBS repeat-containing protein [Phycisphaerales bacterium]